MERRLTNKEKIRIKMLSAEGIKMVDIAKQLKITPSAVSYHVDIERRERIKSRSLYYQRNLSKEQRLRRKDYMRNYMKERYNSDKNFRERRKASANKWHKKQK